MIIYLDTETTALRPGQICQLSYIMQTERTVNSKNFFFTVDGVEFGAYKVHGFSQEKLSIFSSGKRFGDHVAEIEEDLCKADVLISHNTAFDFMFLRAEFERVGRIFTVNNEFCSMKKSTPVCKLLRSDNITYKYPKLNELTAYFDIKDWQIRNQSEKLFGFESDFHDARFDATAVFLAVNEGMKSEMVFERLKMWL